MSKVSSSHTPGCFSAGEVDGGDSTGMGMPAVHCTNVTTPIAPGAVSVSEEGALSSLICAVEAGEAGSHLMLSSLTG